MTDKQKKSLLRVARRVIESAIRHTSVGQFNSEDPVFNEHRGCFVTIHNQGQLRGCIGIFQSDKPLLKNVVDMAAEATRDSRFTTNPITPAELDQIDIEISILSPLELTHDPLSLELGTHGIYIKRGWAGGCFLPQVALETGWTKEQFLSNCCSGKAGLPQDAWKGSDTQVFFFTAEVFGEKDFINP